LPFADRSFDTVVCCEVLEHLADGLFEKVTAELARVTCHSLVIGVPYRQDLRQGMTRCADWGTRYHVYLHQRSFRGPQDLLHVVPGFTPEWETAVLTVKQRCKPYHADLRRLRRRSMRYQEAPHG
jgi:hypothetical protein